jgi:hypothetical protein
MERKDIMRSEEQISFLDIPLSMYIFFKIIYPQRPQRTKLVKTSAPIDCFHDIYSTFQRLRWSEMGLNLS